MSGWQGQYQQPWQQAQNTGSSWQDPRFTNKTSHPANPPVAHTPLSSGQPFNVPNALDTSNWGVRYHQAQQYGHAGDVKPPLPPRPTSALAHTPSPAPGQPWQTPIWQSPVQQTPTGHLQDPGYGTGNHWTSNTYANPWPPGPLHHDPPSHSPGPMPPTPPPRPSAYQSQAQIDPWHLQHQQHFQGSDSHNYDSIGQGQMFNPQQPLQGQLSYQPPNPDSDQGPSISQTQSIHGVQSLPVSPEITPAMPWMPTAPVQPSPHHRKPEPGSSALGVGGPSDWEHFQGSIGDVEDEETMGSASAQSRPERPSSSEAYAELPANTSNTVSNEGSSQQALPQPMKPTHAVAAKKDAPIREHSVSPEPGVAGLRRTSTIDGVIQAWSTPLDSSNTGPSRQSSVSTLDRSRHDAQESIKSSPRQVPQYPQPSHDQEPALDRESHAQNGREQPPSPTRIRPPQASFAPQVPLIKTVEVDPYADIGPEYRASLARYVTMLRKEEAAPEEEKYKIFKAFMLKENRLRCILYSVEPDDPDVILAPRQGIGESTRQSNESQATPEKAPKTSSSLQTDGNPSQEHSTPQPPLPKLSVTTNPTSNEESFVVVERDDASVYSPGGRPRMPRNAPKRTASHPAPRSPPKEASSPSDYAPIVVDELPKIGKFAPALAKDPHSRPGTAPLATRVASNDDPIKFEPPRPAYTPFRYAEGPQRGSEPMVILRPAYQAYSALRHQSVDSGRAMAQSTMDIDRVASPSGNRICREHEEAFLGLIRERSRAYRADKQENAPTTSVNPVPPPDPTTRLTRAINALHEIIPTTMPQKRQPSPRIIEVEKAMEKYPDVFTWIPETVVKWDRQNRIIRRKQDEQRQMRQEESEKNIDALFNDHEIGYSDIGQLEAEFKLAEATKKYDEDAQELESFVEGVFKPVTERLKEELSQLNAQYIRTVDLLELESDSGSRYIQGSGDHPSRSEAAQIVLSLYHKLQIRYIKIAEAHYERERRRKKLELSVLYTNGDTKGIKQLEQEFAKAERQQALREAREKDLRANKLMDTIDRATVRGLGDNQQFIDDVVAKLRSISDLLKESQERPADLLVTGLPDLLRSLEELLDYTANDSKSLLTISNTADNLLNNADYDVSMAEAKLANSTPESERRLVEEKVKEDEKLRVEMDSRMGSVEKGPEYALSLLRSIMKRVGDDPQHQDRVQKALEAAKLRNASKTPVE